MKMISLGQGIHIRADHIVTIQPNYYGTSVIVETVSGHKYSAELHWGEPAYQAVDRLVKAVDDALKGVA